MFAHSLGAIGGLSSRTHAPHIEIRDFLARHFCHMSVSGLLPGHVRILAGKMPTTCASETCQPQRHFGASKTTGRPGSKIEVSLKTSPTGCLRWDTCNELHQHQLTATLMLENHTATLVKKTRNFRGLRYAVPGPER